MNNDTDRAQGLDGSPAHPSTSRRGVLSFVAVVVVCAAAAIGYAAYVVERNKAAATPMQPMSMVQMDRLPGPSTDPAQGASSPAKDRAGGSRPHLLFRSTALGESYGRLSAEFLDAPGSQRLVSRLECDRIHFAAGRGICLEAKRGALTTYHAHIFDRSLAIKASFALAGPPSRARMSADGRLAAVTVFVTGHSYGSPGFTTRTSVIDAAAGRWLVDDLESYEVVRAGAVIKAADFNFWGVTFTGDGRRFYATLGTAGKTLLVEGDLATRRMQVLRDDVECPSLSPDGQRIAFKRRQTAANQGRLTWGIHVLELATGKETALGRESRNVDDQVEWLSNRELLYALPKEAADASASTDVWAMAADGKSPPRLLIPLAFSPAVVP